MSKQSEIMDRLAAAQERREAQQMQRLMARAKTQLKDAGLEVEAELVVNPLQAILPLALLEKWDVTRLLDEIGAYAADSAAEGEPEPFDKAVRAAWQAAGQTFGTASLLAGLITAYSGAVRSGEGFAAAPASVEPSQESSEVPPEPHHPEARRPTALKPLAPFRRRAPLDAQRSDQDDA